MKTVVITGVNRGIGLATAKKFLAEGWRVIGTSRQNKTPIKTPDFVSLKLDLSVPKSIVETAEKIKKDIQNIDVLVNNAGIITDALDKTADVEKLRKTFETNVFGLIDFTEKLLPKINSGGHIINISSIYGAFSPPIDDETSTGYRMSKAALNMYTRTLAFRLKPKNIIVSSLHPGWVKTDMGWEVASEGDQPNVEPDKAAEDIYSLAVSNVESGHFWQFGKNREW